MADGPADEIGPPPMRPTLSKIVATLGPASDSPAMVSRLIDSGVSVFRLNFSHGSFEDHARRLQTVREAAESLDRPIAVMGDLQGPKIRIGDLPPEGVTVEAGQDVVLGRTGTARAGAAYLPCNYPGIGAEVAPGHRVLIDDGALRLLAVGSSEGVLHARVLVGGRVTSRKGINLPDSDVQAPALTDRDWTCVEWSVRHGVDLLALSFVRRASEVLELRRALTGMCSVNRREDSRGEGAMIPVIAKIEKPQAVQNLDAILEASDGIMVARGDLGVEMDLAQVPIVQKRIIEQADAWGKPCIVATQMLETMIDKSTPTRAEASDVANAILDGADAVMLSGETAVGRHPDLVVETMRRIIATAEQRVAERRTVPSPPRKSLEIRYRTAALAHGAWHVARGIGAKLVVVWSQRGGAARYLSQTGFSIPIIAYSSDARQTRRMALLSGVTPFCADVPACGSLAEFNRRAEADLLARGWVARGDPVLILAGCPLGQAAATNSMAIHYIGNPTTGYLAH